MDKLGSPRRLSPSSKMGRNDPCWCGSGIKWKKCHKDRGSKKSTTLNAVISNVSAQFRKKIKCFHPDAGKSCSGAIIKSHTVQKSGPLRAIARDGHVYGIKESGDNIVANDGFLEPKLVGISKASVFPGFCKIHDNDLFAPIEGADIPFNEANAHLFGYRAISNELFYKMQSVATNKIIKEMDAGRSLYTQRLIQQMASDFDYNNDPAVEELQITKSELVEMFRTKVFDQLDGLVIQFDTLLPFAFTCAVAPFYDLDMVDLQSHDDKFLDYVTVSTYVVRGKTNVAMVWNKSKKIEKFITSLKSRPLKDVASVILRFALEKTENLFLNPDWFEGLSESERSLMRSLMMIGVLPRSNINGIYDVSDGRLTVKSGCVIINLR
nr:SEC-C metal-binding domain-containing protein [uncultured Brevundimonas sp.]